MLWVPGEFMAKMIKKERLSVAAALAAAILAFPLVLVAAGFVVCWITIGVVNCVCRITAAPTPTCLQFDVVLSGIVWGLPILTAYYVSRVVYVGMRWQRVEAQKGRYCVNCEYDLTGNVSGRCPGCGTSVGELPPPVSERDGEAGDAIDGLSE